jgi:hypothetical protein
MRRIGGIVLLSIACALLFLIPSAYARYHGAPRWLAAGLGVLAFPILPLAWHGLAERRRKKAGGKSALTGGDRFLFKIVAIALVAVVPIAVLDGGGLWRAMKSRATWWLDWTDPPAPRSPVSDPRMLEAIPGDAEALVWSLDVERLGEAVLALGPDAMMVVIHDEPEKLDLLRTDDLAFLAQMRGYPGGVVTERPAPDLMIVVSERWTSVPRGGSALAGRLRAPPGATAVAVWRPTKDAPVPVVEAVGWVIDGRVEGRLTMERAADGDTMRRQLKTYSDELFAVLRRACPEDVGPVIDAVTVGGKGVDVRIHASLHKDRLITYLGCFLSPTRDTP